MNAFLDVSHAHNLETFYVAYYSMVSIKCHVLLNVLGSDFSPKVSIKQSGLFQVLRASEHENLGNLKRLY